MTSSMPIIHLDGGLPYRIPLAAQFHLDHHRSSKKPFTSSEKALKFASLIKEKEKKRGKKKERHKMKVENMKTELTKEMGSGSEPESEFPQTRRGNIPKQVLPQSEFGIIANLPTTTTERGGKDFRVKSSQGITRTEKHAGNRFKNPIINLHHHKAKSTPGSPLSFEFRPKTGTQPIIISPYLFGDQKPKGLPKLASYSKVKIPSKYPFKNVRENLRPIKLFDKHQIKYDVYSPQKRFKKYSTSVDKGIYKKEGGVSEEKKEELRKKHKIFMGELKMLKGLGHELGLTFEVLINYAEPIGKKEKDESKISKITENDSFKMGKGMMGIGEYSAEHISLVDAEGSNISQGLYINPKTSFESQNYAEIDGNNIMASEILDKKLVQDIDERIFHTSISGITELEELTNLFRAGLRDMTKYKVPFGVLETFEQLWKTMILNYEILWTYQSQKIEDGIVKSQNSAEEVIEQCKLSLDDHAEKWKKLEIQFREKENRTNLAFSRLIKDKNLVESLLESREQEIQDLANPSRYFLIHYLLRELDPRIKEDEFSIHRKVKTVNRLLTVMEEDIKLEEQANALIHRGGRLMSPTGGNSIPRVNKNLDIPGNLGLLLKKIIKRYKLTTTDINEIRTEMFQRTSGEKEEELKTTATIGIQVENIEHNFEEIQEEGTINVLKLFIQKRKKTELNISDTGQIISPMAPNIVFSMLEEFVEDKLKKEFKTKDVKESNFGGFVYENFLVKFGLKSLALTGFQSMHLTMQKAAEKRMEYSILLMQCLQTYDRKKQEVFDLPIVSLVLKSICLFNQAMNTWMSKVHGNNMTFDIKEHLDLDKGGVVNVIQLIDLLKCSLRQQPKIAKKILPQLYSDSFYQLSHQDKIINAKYKFAVDKICYSIDQLDITLKDLFDSFDNGEKGYLTRAEISEGFQKNFGWVITRKDLNYLLEHMDADGNGIIDFQEFKEHISRDSDWLISEDLLISKSKFIRLMIENHLSHQEAEMNFLTNLLKRHDVNADGVLQLSEFESIMREIEPNYKKQQVIKIFAESLEVNVDENVDILTPQAFHHSVIKYNLGGHGAQFFHHYFVNLYSEPTELEIIEKKYKENKGGGTPRHLKRGQLERRVKKESPGRKGSLNSPKSPNSRSRDSSVGLGSRKGLNTHHRRSILKTTPGSRSPARKSVAIMQDTFATSMHSDKHSLKGRNSITPSKNSLSPKRNSMVEIDLGVYPLQTKSSAKFKSFSKNTKK